MGRKGIEVGCLKGGKLNNRTGWSSAALNQFVTEFRSASGILESAQSHLEDAIMRQIPLYQRIDGTCLYSSKARQSGQPGPAALRAGNLLAVVCLSFGTALAAFVPAALEQRIVSLFFFCLIPAVWFLAGGDIFFHGVWVGGGRYDTGLGTSLLYTRLF